MSNQPDPTQSRLVSLGREICRHLETAYSQSSCALIPNGSLLAQEATRRLFQSAFGFPQPVTVTATLETTLNRAIYLPAPLAALAAPLVAALKQQIGPPEYVEQFHDVGLPPVVMEGHVIHAPRVKLCVLRSYNIHNDTVQIRCDVNVSRWPVSPWPRWPAAVRALAV